ncbi:MAG: phosphonate ABC transporter ATP-binding protein [Candidatus Marinimicrobia bacterium CG1_02_48_14]|nr:MAG: phosphonate ABC transporter ATP-binding protein [Candidatus Marinimicrobia bacterium CG1_02_48_14]PJA55110.1 MAG: phosphonate ABC transporter ATP-binding protein [Candidatus Marinimicrobia bacterium CG_4_9_14_3_um_filter_48_9]
MKIMIRTSKLTKVFRTEEVETTALNQVDLEVRKGEFLAIMGPSGCGKSTILNILGLLDTPSGGEFYFLDHDILKANDKERTALRRNHIGFVFQNFNLIDELSVFENVELPLLYQNVPAAERKQRVDELLGKVGVAHRRNHFPQHLSGGQQQRAAVARALVTKPAVILADEPTGNLDTKHGEEVMALLSDLNDEGTTIVMVTHSPEYARHADRIVNLLDGEIQNIQDNGSYKG